MNDNKYPLNTDSRQDDVTRISEAGVRPTAVRLMIYRLMKSMTAPVSSIDIETALETVDRSTISRTLTIFLEHSIIHSIDDGSGLLKYEVCRGTHDHSIHDMHVHFRCRRCGKTICLPSTAIPEVELPNGFIPENANYVLSGLCDRFSKVNSQAGACSS